MEDARVRPNRRTGKPLRPRTLGLYQDYKAILLKQFSSDRIAATLRRGEVREWITTCVNVGSPRARLGTPWTT